MGGLVVRYFFLIAYTSFVNDPAGFTVVKFSTWLQSRVEIGKMISRLRKTEHFFVFAPVQDLSLIAKGDAGALSASNSLSKVRFADVQRDGGDVVGSEWAQQIVRVSPSLGCLWRLGNQTNVYTSF